MCVSPLRCNRLGWRCSFQGLGTRVFSVTVFGHPGGAIFIMKKKRNSGPKEQKKRLFRVVPPSWQPKKVIWFCAYSMQSIRFDLVDFFFAYVQTVLCCNFCFLLWLLFSVAAAAFFCPATVFFFCCFVLCMLFVARCSLLGLFLAFLFFFMLMCI